MIDRSSISEVTIKIEAEKEITIKKGGKMVEEVVEPQQVQLPAIETMKPTPVSESNKTVEKEEKVETSVSEENVHTITSPMVGTFYGAPSPKEDSFCSIWGSGT